jgi:hypothetical protein
MANSLLLKDWESKIKANVYSEEGALVGKVTYAISPLFDKIYIFDITIDESWRRQGFGLAAIKHILSTYGLPIVTIKEVGSARDFWRNARQAALGKGQVITTLSVSEMDEERSRWAHLAPHVKELERLISERLFSLREEYEIAVGRGLPDWEHSVPRYANAVMNIRKSTADHFR